MSANEKLASRSNLRFDEPLVFGSRKSALALWQTRTVVRQLQMRYPGLQCEIVHFDTAGDKNLDQPLPEIGGKGLFTAELDAALRDGKIAVAVHSLKDLPTEESDCVTILPLLEREDPRDVLITKRGKALDDLPSGAVIGTSSPRRISQLRSMRSDLVMKSIRGNIQTRISRVESGEYDAIVLAAAGVIRMELSDLVSQWFSTIEVLPAPGQGCLAVAYAAQAGIQAGVGELLKPFIHLETEICVRAERLLLQYLGGGCSAPLGAVAELVAKNTKSSASTVRLTGRITTSDGKEVLTRSASGNGPENVALEVANQLIEGGAAHILENAVQNKLT